MTRKKLIAFCLTFPGAYEDYPFNDTPEPGGWAVMRHCSNKKGFAHIFEMDGRLCVNLKAEPAEADFLRQAFTDITPAYHMNKEHWNTVRLNGDVPDQEVRRLIACSYDLIKPNKRKKGGKPPRGTPPHERCALRGACGALPSVSQGRGTGSSY